MPIITPILSHPAAGPAPGCIDCPENGNAAYDDGYFSWAACPGCPEPEGGIRYAAHAVFADHSYDHMDICGDCLNAIANEDTEGRTDRLSTRYTPA